jgi:G:T-mismatch repair DNA endonuclease (very short patch repair protein)
MDLPRANREFWKSKFDANLTRDAKAATSLEALNLDVEIIWEHEIRLDATARAVGLAELVRKRRELLYGATALRRSRVGRAGPRPGGVPSPRPSQQ